MVQGVLSFLLFPGTKPSAAGRPGPSDHHDEEDNDDHDHDDCGGCNYDALWMHFAVYPVIEYNTITSEKINTNSQKYASKNESTNTKIHKYK